MMVTFTEHYHPVHGGEAERNEVDETVAYRRIGTYVASGQAAVHRFVECRDGSTVGLVTMAHQGGKIWIAFYDTKGW